MSVVIIMPDREVDARRLAENLRTRCSGLEIRVWPDSGNPGDVSAVVTWNHPPDALNRFPNLRLLASFGAGVDHMLADHSIPAGAAVVRTVAHGLARDIAEYVVAAVSRHRRGLRGYARDQRERRWQPRPYPAKYAVLVLGLGAMGATTARALTTLGYEVHGWRARPHRHVDGVTPHVGRSALERTLPEVDAVVCLLPLTPATDNVLDSGFFSHMKPGSLLINVARGRHLVEDDLLQALDLGRPGHAVLDVARIEPLPPDHPFWDHPGITLTPHIAALTNPEAAADHIAENLRRLEAGEALLDVVELARGY